MNRKAVEYAAVAITGAVVGYYLYKSMDKINLEGLDTPAPVGSPTIHQHKRLLQETLSLEERSIDWFKRIGLLG